MTSDYRPIDCDRHSEYELLAMRREAVEIIAAGESGPVRGRVVDVVTRDGAEYLVVQEGEGGSRWLRLDRLLKVRRQRDGRAL